MSGSDTPKPRRKWIAFGELIALAALVVSGLGLWNSWRGGEQDKAGPTEVIERKSPVPLVLRGRVEDDGKRLEIVPVEPGHALESLTLKAKDGVVDVGGDGIVQASDLEAAAKALDPDRKDEGSLRVTINARYVEAGVERRSSRSYAIGYRWDGGGLFGGRSLRITAFRRA